MEDDEVMTFVWEKPEPPRYYIPLTLNQLVADIQRMIKDPDTPIDGNELIVDTRYLHSSGYSRPPNTIVFELEKHEVIKGEDQYGTVYFQPYSPRIFS